MVCDNFKIAPFGVVYTTRDTATIHTPKCRQLKITRVVTGTDTTVTKSGRDTEQTSPEVDIRKVSPHTAETQIRTGYFTCEVTSHAQPFIFTPAKSNITPHELTDARPDRLRILVLNAYRHNHKYDHF